MSNKIQLFQEPQLGTKAEAQILQSLEFPSFEWLGSFVFLFKLGELTFLEQFFAALFGSGPQHLCGLAQVSSKS